MSNEDGKESKLSKTVIATRISWASDLGQHFSYLSHSSLIMFSSIWHTRAPALVRFIAALMVSLLSRFNLFVLHAVLFSLYTFFFPSPCLPLLLPSRPQKHASGLTRASTPSSSFFTYFISSVTFFRRL